MTRVWAVGIGITAFISSIAFLGYLTREELNSASTSTLAGPAPIAVASAPARAQQKAELSRIAMQQNDAPFDGRAVQVRLQTALSELAEFQPNQGYLSISEIRCTASSCVATVGCSRSCSVTEIGDVFTKVSEDAILQRLGVRLALGKLSIVDQLVLIDLHASLSVSG